MLWEIIRDFIVQNITGGTLSDGNVIYLDLGTITTYANGVEDDSANLTPIYSKVASMGDFDYYINFNDWLATTFTIIAMCLIVAFAIWLVRWVFKAVTSAFLLRR